MDDKFNKIGLPRVFSGDASDVEMKQVYSWIKESESNRAEYYRLKDIWDSINSEPDVAKAELERFYALLNSGEEIKTQAQELTHSQIFNQDQNQSQSPNQSNFKHNRFWRGSYLKLSASVAAVLLIGVLIGSVTTHLFSSTEERAVATNRFMVPMGSKATVMLPDGTEVVLNSGSELIYPEVFSADLREVTLNGEGYFKVHSDVNHPFTVHSTNMDIVVTGTEFNVSAYPDDNYVSTTLVEGKIRATSPIFENDINLLPEDRLVYDFNKRSVTVQKISTENTVAWKDERFSFKSIELSQLAKRLERWYNVRLNLEGEELQLIKFTGKFKNQETIWQVLNAISLTTPIDYKKSGLREFTITHK